MMAAAPAVYNEFMFGMCWRGAAALLIASLCWLGLGTRASAAQQIGVGPNPWLDVQLQSGTLTVNTWDRPQVQITSTGHVNVSHVDATQADSRIPHQYTAWSQTVPTDHGVVRLPEESFVLPQLQGSSHDAIVASGDGNTTITIPRSTALVTAHVGSGQLNLNGYNGAFVTQVRDGNISLNHVNGSGYAESVGGSINATNSTFQRLRVRTATGNMVFRGCTSHQIEASSKYGSIVYDNGRFQPGLAHFESEHGNVSLGVRGGAQIGAHSGSGQTVQENVRGGGPVVTAVSKHGSVYLYKGNVPTRTYAPSQANAAARTDVAPHTYVPAARTDVAPRVFAPAPRSDTVAPRNYAPPRNYMPPGYPGARAPQYAPPQGYRQNTPQYPRQGGPPPYPRQGGQQAYPRQNPPQSYPRQGAPPPNGSGEHHRHQPPA